MPSWKTTEILCVQGKEFKFMMGPSTMHGKEQTVVMDNGKNKGAGSGDRWLYWWRCQGRSRRESCVGDLRERGKGLYKEDVVSEEEGCGTVTPKKLWKEAEEEDITKLNAFMLRVISSKMPKY